MKPVKNSKKNTKAPATIAKEKVAKKPAQSSEPVVNAHERIDNKIASLDDFRGQRLKEIRKLIHEVDPAVIEEWKWMGTPTWSNHGIYVIANAHKDKVKVTFAQGAKLSDPKQLFNNGLDGSKWRAIDIHDGYKLNASAFKALLREAIAYNKTQAASKSTVLRSRTASTAVSRSKS